MSIMEAHEVEPHGAARQHKVKPHGAARQQGARQSARQSAKQSAARLNLLIIEIIVDQGFFGFIFHLSC